MSDPNEDASARIVAGRYRLGPTLGSGAYTKSFDAVDLETGSPVVLKLLPSQFGASSSFVDRFHSDLIVAASLEHPNIVRISDFGVEEVGGKSYPFVVSEQQAGGSLRAFLDRGRTLSPSQALMMAIDACRGLAHAHGRGLVHGAVNPSNLLFDADRRVRVADFGISRLVADIAWRDPGRLAVDVARYASPEHALGLPLEAQSDVYSLCLTLVESVTGQVPFAAETSVATLSARLDRLMPVSADLGALAAVLERAGRPLVADRYTAVEFGRALVGAAQNMPRPEPIAVVGLGRFGEPTLPNLTDTAGATPFATGEIAVIGNDIDVSGALANAAAGQGVEQPAEFAPPADDPLALLAQVPDAPGLEVGIGPEWGTDQIVDTYSSDTYSPDTGLQHDDGFNPMVGSVAADERVAAALPIEQVAPAPRRRRATRVEQVEGDDDVLNIDRRGMARFGLAALAIVVLAVAAVVVFRVLSTPSRSVPNLIGMTEEEATNVVADNGWDLDIRRQRDDAQPQGSVVRTDPATGERLKEGDTIVLVVSDGPTLSRLQDIAGLTVDTARGVLTELGLTLREVEQQPSESVAAGSVITWSVAGDATLTVGSEVPKGTTIDVVVSSGSSRRTVPDVAGLDVEQATAALESVGLVVGGTSEGFSETVVAGLVLGSQPEVGTEVTAGDAVVLVLSKGRDLVKVPNVIGKTLLEATDALTKAGLQIGSVTGASGGRVTWTNVSAGAQVSRGTRVSMTLDVPPTTTTTIP